MRKINIYDDGKMGRGIKALLIKKKGNRMLIKFNDPFNDKGWVAWFKRDKRSERNTFWHSKTNSWFFEDRETAEFSEKCRDWFTPEYHGFLFGT